MSGCSSARARWTSERFFSKRSTRSGWWKAVPAGHGKPDWAERAKPRLARQSVCAKRKSPRRRWLNWSAASARIRASLTTRLKNCVCSPATASKLEVRTWPPFARGTNGAGIRAGRRAGRPGFAAFAPAAGRGTLGNKIQFAKIGNWPALRFDFQGARDVAAERDAARRLDQAGDGLQPVQGATGARARRQAARWTRSSTRWR